MEKAVSKMEKAELFSEYIELAEYSERLSVAINMYRIAEEALSYDGIYVGQEAYEKAARTVRDVESTLRATQSRADEVAFELNERFEEEYENEQKKARLVEAKQAGV